MSKIRLIIKREYTTRVMKPSFLILTFLTPILMAGLITVPILLSQIRDTSQKTIVVIDQTGLYTNVLHDSENFKFEFANEPIDSVRKSRDSESYAAILLISDDLNINPRGATLFSQDQVGLELKLYVTNMLKAFVEEQRLAALNIPNFRELVEQTKVSLDVRTVMWSKDGQEKFGSTELALIIGMISAFLIYIFIVVYGAQVMSGVVQEKTNRIVEVIVSSVKPFQLMMGKIIGIAMVGLTQFALWVVLSLVFVFGITKIIGVEMDVETYQQAQMMGVTNNVLALDSESGVISELLLGLKNFDFVQTGILFVVYFLGGYLLYASLFAAVGSAVDNETDTQQFSLPLTLPIIFAIYAAIYSAENPDGPLAFWCSMIPFTSPIVMMVRLPFGVAFWEIALSLGILVLSFIGSTWIAAKIYRTGILMYGKKISWREMIKWISYKG